jgi:hypothetical protein
MICCQTALSANVTIPGTGVDQTVATLNFSGKTGAWIFLANTGAKAVSWRIGRVTGGVASYEEPDDGTYNTLAASGTADWNVPSNTMADSLVLYVKTSEVGGSTVKWQSQMEIR